MKMKETHRSLPQVSRELSLLANTSDARETEMVEARWRTFEFTHQIAQTDQKTIPPCGRCFPELVMLGRDV